MPPCTLLPRIEQLLCLRMIVREQRFGNNLGREGSVHRVIIHDDANFAGWGRTVDLGWRQLLQNVAGHLLCTAE